MIVGIAVDNWKLPIYERHITNAGYLYTQEELPHGCTMFRISCEHLENFIPVMEAANKECARIRCPDCGDS